MDNFRFANPHFLWLLLLAVVLVALFLLGRFLSGKALKRFGSVPMLHPLISGFSSFKLQLKFFLHLIALICLIIAAARPQFGTKLETVKKEGVEVMVCLDISNSMLAEDISPNRLEKSKRMLARMLDQMENDKVGLVVFAGDAVVQLPITNDYISAKMFLSSINPSYISAQGTAIGAAINLAARSFTPNEESSKAIVLITDAENHEDDASGAATAAYDNGIPVHVIGVGSTKGTVLPDGSGRSNSLRKDSNGNPVTTRFNEEIAQQIAQSGHGIYAHADNTNSAISAVVENLHKMKTIELDSHVYAEYDDQFMWFAFAALFILAIDFFILDRASSLFSNVKLFEK